MNTAFICDYPDNIKRVFGEGAIEGVYPTVIGSANFDSHIAEINSVEAAFSSWGFPAFSESQIAEFKNLKYIFYGAGSVRAFAEPYLKRGVRVVSAAAANGVFVAEYTFAQMILAQKGYFRLVNRGLESREEVRLHPAPGNYGALVGIIGAGHIGRMVIEKLRTARARVLVYDPYLSDAYAQTLGVERADLAEIFSTCEIVSNHAPNIPETEKMLTGEMFRSMIPYATFINTGRGATVDEEAMLDALDTRRDITALLDVTWPEPPKPDSRVFSLPNVFHTPHIAGSIGREVRLMGEMCMEEYARCLAGEPLRHEVTLEQFYKLA